MSEENVERTLLLYDAWNRRDPEAVILLLDPEVVWFPGVEGDAEGGRTYRGHAGMRQYFADLAEWTEEGRLESEEVHALGDQVLVLGRLWLRSASGVDLESELATLTTWRDGKCIEGRSRLSHAEGLEAAGLSE